MNKLWSDRAWDDYLYWQTQDKKTAKKINELIISIEREGVSEGLGKPEPLKGKLTNHWSRHIDRKNRLIDRVYEDEQIITIISLRGHYSDK